MLVVEPRRRAYVRCTVVGCSRAILVQILIGVVSKVIGLINMFSHF